MAHARSLRVATAAAAALAGLLMSGCDRAERAFLAPGPGAAHLRPASLEEAPELDALHAEAWDGVAAYELALPREGHVTWRMVAREGQRSQEWSETVRFGAGRVVGAVAFRAIDADEALAAIEPLLLDEEERTTLREALADRFYYRLASAFAGEGSRTSSRSSLRHTPALALPEPQEPMRAVGLRVRDSGHVTLTAGEPRVVQGWAWGLGPSDRMTLADGGLALYGTRHDASPGSRAPLHRWHLEITFSPLDDTRFEEAVPAPDTPDTEGA